MFHDELIKDRLVLGYKDIHVGGILWEKERHAC